MGQDLVTQREFEKLLTLCREQCVNDVKALKELLGTRLDNMQNNVLVAKEATDQHFKLTNEWRVLAEAILDSKADKEVTTKIEADIRILREDKAMLAGKASQQSVYIGYLIGFAGLLLAAIALLKG